MRVRLTTRLLALVALEIPLLDELLRFRSKIAVVAVRQCPFLRLINRIPPGTDVNTTRKTNLFSTLRCRRAVGATIAVDDGGERGTPVRRCGLRPRRRGLGRQRNLVRLSRASGKRQVGLLKVLHVELKRV
jgi:hypothetical protein